MYVFRTMSRDDLPMIERWLVAPEVMRWWGEPEMIGCGHGSKFIRQFVDDLLQRGTPRVVTDPSPTNDRAIRAYEKAGFTKVGVVETPDGPSLMMVRP